MEEELKTLRKKDIKQKNTSSSKRIHYNEEKQERDSLRVRDYYQPPAPIRHMR